MKRCARIESAVINELYDTVAAQPQNHDKDPDQLLGKALTHNDALSRHSRRETQLARRYHAAMKELREARKRRAQAPSSAASMPRCGPNHKPNRQPTPIPPPTPTATLK